MSTDDESRRDRERIAELNEIHARLRWWSDNDIVELIAEDRELAKAVWRDRDARRTLLRALVEVDSVAADRLRENVGDERWAEWSGLSRRTSGVASGLREAGAETWERLAGSRWPRRRK